MASEYENKTLQMRDEHHSESMHSFEMTDSLGMTGIRFRFEDVHDKAEGIWCEMYADRTYPSMDDKDDKQLLGPERVNLLVTTTWQKRVMERLVTMIDEQYDWLAALQDTVGSTVNSHREMIGMTDMKTFIMPDEIETFLLKPLVSASGVTVLYGRGEVGKSTIATAIAIAIAGWQPLWGVFPEKQGNVLYVDYEDTNIRLYSRVNALLDGFGMSMDDLEHTIIHAPTSRQVVQMQRQLTRMVKDYDIQLVIVDSVATARGGEAFGADDTVRFFRALNSLGVPVLALDHLTKEDVRSDKAPTPYGSVFTINLSRLMWAVVQNDDASRLPNMKQLNMTNTKANNTGRQSPFGFTLEYQSSEKGNATSISLEMNQGVWDEDAPEFTPRDRIVRFLEDDPSSWRTTKAIRIGTKLSEKQVSYAVNQLVGNMTIVKKSLGGQGNPDGYLLKTSVEKEG